MKDEGPEAARFRLLRLLIRIMRSLTALTTMTATITQPSCGLPSCSTNPAPNRSSGVQDPGMYIHECTGRRRSAGRDADLPDRRSAGAHAVERPLSMKDENQSEMRRSCWVQDAS